MTVLQGADLEVADFPAEILAQAEEASRIFNEQAEAAMIEMEAVLKGERAS